MKRSLALLLGITSLLAACAPGLGGSLAPVDGSDGIEHPTGDDLVFSVESQGGFVPVEFVATALPSFTLLGDGRVIVPGAMTLIYPGPAVPPLQVRTLTEEGMQELLAAIVETELFDADLELRGAQNIVADAADTVFTLHAGGREVTVTVYGLGTLDPSTPMEGVSAAEAQAHRTLSRMNDQLTILEEWLPEDAFADDGWQPYEPEAFRLYVSSVDQRVAPDPNLPPEPPRPWPADGDPATFGEPYPLLNGRCGVAEGDDAATWLEALSQANQLTRWSSGDHVYTVLPRALLPHEERVCPT